MIDYESLTTRNYIYIPAAIQEKIRTTRLLIAGCGIGSTIAETALRTGYTKLTLVDNDSIAEHNLNRQNFRAEDVGTQKVAALASRLRAIYPAAEITEVAQWLSKDNVEKLVGSADYIFDTIDFLSLEGIVALHDEARRQNKTIFSALSIGWGAGAMCFTPENPWTFRRIFGLPERGLAPDASYVEHFKPLIERLADRLKPDVIQAMSHAFKIMKDGKPCPAPQIAPGAATVAALSVTALTRLIQGMPVRQAPELMVADLDSVVTSPGLMIAPAD